MKTLIEGLLRYSRVTTQGRRLEEMGARTALRRGDGQSRPGHRGEGGGGDP